MGRGVQMLMALVGIGFLVAILATVAGVVLMVVPLGDVSEDIELVPPPDPPTIFGVHVHFTREKAGELKMLAEVGCKMVRNDITWANVEKEAGVYNFSQYDRFLDDLAAHNLTALLIFDYTNRLYDNNSKPHTEAGINAFTNFVLAAVERFQGRGVIWEMWNEPDAQNWWGAGDNSTGYARLANAVGRALKTAYPQEIFVGPATIGWNFKFLESIFQLGVLEWFDYVSIHGYTNNLPEDWLANYNTLVRLIKKYKPERKPEIRVLCSEWGRSSNRGKGVSEAEQGRWLPRQILITMATRVYASIWYDWHDIGWMVFGLVGKQYHPDRNPVYDPKPSYRSAQFLTRTLDGFTHRKTVVNGSDYVLYFKDHSATVITAWTIAKTNHTIEIQLPRELKRNSCFYQFDLFGEQLPRHCANGYVLNLAVSQSVVYLTSPDTSP